MAEYQDATILLPFPPSLNGLFAGKSRRYRSKAYKEWSLEAGLMLMRQKPLPAFLGKVNVVITCGRPDNRKRDLGNLEKAVTDKLVEVDILEDDSLIECLTIRWGDVVGCQVDIQKCFPADLPLARRKGSEARTGVVLDSPSGPVGVG